MCNYKSVLRFNSPTGILSTKTLHANARVDKKLKKIEEP